MPRTNLRRNVTILLLWWGLGATAAVAQLSNAPRVQIQDTGISGLWVLANISFAGMRAQNNRSVLWRTIAFIFGLPGTIITFFAVGEGSERAYGHRLTPAEAVVEVGK